MNYLLDTCVISEVTKKIPDQDVLRWLDAQDEEKIFLSVLTLGELQKGISRLPDGLRKNTLQSWLTNELADRFSGRIIGIDRAVATALGKRIGEYERKGDKLPIMDALISVTADVHHLTVVTRNERDMTRCGAKVFNPWIKAEK